MNLVPLSAYTPGFPEDMERMVQDSPGNLQTPPVRENAVLLDTPSTTKQLAAPGGGQAAGDGISKRLDMEQVKPSATVVTQSQNLPCQSHQKHGDPALTEDGRTCMEKEIQEAKLRMKNDRKNAKSSCKAATSYKGNRRTKGLPWSWTRKRARERPQAC